LNRNCDEVKDQVQKILKAEGTKDPTQTCLIHPPEQHRIVTATKLKSCERYQLTGGKNSTISVDDYLRSPMFTSVAHRFQQ